jgi:phosphotransferase family enzyme
VTDEAPLAAMLARALGVRVEDVQREPLGRRAGSEVERVRFTSDGSERSVAFHRLAPRSALEVQLLPFLARKTTCVPVVHARGIPPATVAAPPWILLEDLEDAPTACDRDPKAILDALVTVEQAVAGDIPALRALGVPERSPADVANEVVDASRQDGAADAIAADANEAARRLAGWPTALVHGDLVCGNAVAIERGVVLRGWGRAYLGCGLLDVVRLVADIVQRGDAVRGIGLTRTYAERIGVVLPTDVLRAAEKLDLLSRRYLQ